MKKVHIFDMDGLLINSEPFWRASEIEVFCDLGIPFTEEMCLKTVGMRIDEVVEYWQKDYPQLVDIESISNAIEDGVIRRVKEDGAPLPGVMNALMLLKETHHLCALASSSKIRVIEAVLDKLEIREYFKVVHSAEFEKFGKPHPDVFLTAASKLGAQPQECIVYEDSRNGVKAGLAAGMYTICIPEEYDEVAHWDIAASEVWRSLEEFEIR